MHVFDQAIALEGAGDLFRGTASEAYWAFVGPFGGITAATILSALTLHPGHAGHPLALTVNYCAPVAAGTFDIALRLVRQNRSSQHWLVELSQAGIVVTFASAVFAARRASWSHQEAPFPHAPPFEHFESSPAIPGRWTDQYDFRFIEGDARIGEPLSGDERVYSRLWISDRQPRQIDMLSLTSMSDAFFARVFHAKREIVPFGTVSLTTYFHVDADELAALNITRVLAVVDGKVFHNSFGDQSAELWSPHGRLLATTTQIGYFKA
ncbi:MAG: thioesterase family protein [Alphaproteobacteria bacterium]|nr:thioesterase family protein [Alphaproteobacteria bacterium]